MFTLYASNDVLDEAHRVWRRKFPTLGADMREQREKRFRECFDDILDDWVGGDAPVSDVDDAHVHNAAVFGNVNILLTNNVSDFPYPDQLPYDLYTPDEFFCLIYENDPTTVRNVTRKQAVYWGKRQKMNPEIAPKTLAEALLAAGCPEFSKVVGDCIKFVSGLPNPSAEPELKADELLTHLAPTTP